MYINYNNYSLHYPYQGNETIDSLLFMLPVYDDANENNQFILNGHLSMITVERFLFFIFYLLVLPISLLLFALLLRFLRRQGFITPGTAEELLLQCHSILRGVNASLSSSNSVNNDNQVDHGVHESISNNSSNSKKQVI